MTAFAPVRKVLSNHLILVMATAFLTPSVLLFCAVHKTEVQVCPVFVRVPVKVCMDQGGLVSLAGEQINCRLDGKWGTPVSPVGSVPQAVAFDLNPAYWVSSDEYDAGSTFGSGDCCWYFNLSAFLAIFWILAVAGYAIYWLTALAKGIANAHRS